MFRKFITVLVLILTISSVVGFAETKCDLVIGSNSQMGHKNSGLSNEPIVIPLARLILRAGTPMDLPNLAEIIKEPDVAHNFFVNADWAKNAETYLEMKAGAGLKKLAGGWLQFSFVIQLRNTGEVIGLGGIERYGNTDLWNVAYAIKPEYRRMGYAKETVLGLIEFISNIQPNSTIRARILEKNHSSQELVKSLGFHQVDGYGERILEQDLLYFILQLGRKK